MNNILSFNEYNGYELEKMVYSEILNEKSSTGKGIRGFINRRASRKVKSELSDEIEMSKTIMEGIKEGLETLSKINLLIDSALCFCEKLKYSDKEKFVIHSLKESINDFKIKIEVKEKIIKNLEKKLNENEIKELNDLIEKYKKCKTAEIEDLIELEKINNKSI